MKILTLKRCTLLAIGLVLSISAMAQTTVNGILVDAQTKETLIGAAVVSDKGGYAVTDDAGRFMFKAQEGAQTLTISYLGYETKTVQITAGGRTLSLGTIELKPIAVSLTEVMVTGTIGVARKTPVAISTIPSAIIQEALGTQEFPEILTTTPGVYATKQGGGFGDARMTVRGFDSPNTAVMVNGVPVNDMEWGGVYWSNWMGLSDVTRSMQVQRGLGAAKIAAPSVGGSVNIVTKTTDATKGGSVSYGLGNDGYNKIAFTASTGLMDNGWAISLLGSKTWGDGYILGTEFEGYTYFLSVAKRINDKHEISFTGVGAPQWHNQRYSGDKLYMGEWAKYKEGYRFNGAYGFDKNGQRKSAYYNYYHKPQFSLNHVWNINEKSNLSTALYMSIGRGGGYGGRNRESGSSSAFYGASSGYITTAYRTVDGYFDFGQIQDQNAADPNGSLNVISSSINEHNWYGLLSTYTTKIGENWNVYGGLDVRYYEGIHSAKIMDLLGGAFFVDKYSRSAARNRAEVNDPIWVNQKLREGDIVYRDYTGFVLQNGLFGQAEYSKDGLSAFVSASVNNNTYWRTDRFYYNNETSETANHIGWMAKGGANYNINDNHNVFFNVGGFSRTPFFSGGVFLQAVSSNAVNPDAKNEKIFSAEIGYGFRSAYFSANLNAYYTNWYDKTTTRAVDSSDPSKGSLNLSGVNANHKGIELEAIFKPTRDLEVKGMLAIGDWRWTNSPTGLAYNTDGQPIDVNGNVTTDPTKQATMTLNMKDVHVGNSAQITSSVDVSYNFLNNFRAGMTYRLFAKNYASYSIPTTFGVNSISEPWMIPTGNTFNFRLSYRFKINSLDAILQGNVENLFNNEYIVDANDGSSHDWDTAQVMYAFGRTWSMSLKINF